MRYAVIGCNANGKVKHRGFEEDEEKVQDVVQTIRKVQAETVQRERPVGVGIVYCAYVETVSLADFAG